jgi:dTDP-4-dehydrorhamnose reductase
LARRVLITGGSGLLALNWAVSERSSNQVVLGLHRRDVKLAGTTSAHLSFDSASVLEAQLLEIRPDLLVHAAAMTDVESCESDPVSAFRVNADLPKMIGALCAKHDIPMAHVSTDHLFSGSQAFSLEQHTISPQNVYGASKAEGERLLLEVNPHALVIRTNFYGWGTSYRRSFSDFVIDNLRAGKKISLFTDVFYTPIVADRLVKAAVKLVDLGCRGLVHLVGDERISKYEFGFVLARKFNLDCDLIRAAKYSESPSVVRRPLDMSLSNALARRLLGRTVSTIQDDMRILLEQEALGLATELRTIR